DVAKALELYDSRVTRSVKKPGEDLTSILSGIVAQKGAVSIDICEPLRRDELMQYETMTRAEYVKAVAALIDSRINSAYHLFPNNYIAYDIRYGTNRYAEMYTESQRELFCARLRELEVYHDSEVDVIADIFLGIYANPVNSKTTDR
ncbi:MAG: acyltransferase, partial [Muribaculaceae bacterium]|nr:acyltransferase [Muribaculaceae bacterium]